MESSHDARKFIIAHEYGHANLWLTAGPWTNDCSEQAPGQGTGHWMTSYEYMSCAMMEGWARFAEADVWNDDGDNAQAFIYQSCGGSSIIDVEAAGEGAGCVLQYMETTWTDADDWPGHGTELDWMRTFWDYHTNDLTGQPGSRRSHSQLQAELAASSLGTPQNPVVRNNYDNYREGIAAESGCSQYERLVFMAAHNGANHCQGECDTVAGCTNCDSTQCGYEE
jgi:hypothetical protein